MRGGGYDLRGQFPLRYALAKFDDAEARLATDAGRGLDHALISVFPFWSQAAEHVIPAFDALAMHVVALVEPMCGKYRSALADYPHPVHSRRVVTI